MAPSACVALALAASLLSVSAVRAPATVWEWSLGVDSVIVATLNVPAQALTIILLYPYGTGGYCNILAMDTVFQNPRWEFPAPTAVGSTQAKLLLSTDGSAVFLLDTNGVEGSVRALDISTGAQLWALPSFVPLFTAFDSFSSTPLPFVLRDSTDLLVFGTNTSGGGSVRTVVSLVEATGSTKRSIAVSATHVCLPQSLWLDTDSDFVVVNTAESDGTTSFFGYSPITGQPTWNTPIKVPGTGTSFALRSISYDKQVTAALQGPTSTLVVRLNLKGDGTDYAISTAPFSSRLAFLGVPTPGIENAGLLLLLSDLLYVLPRTGDGSGGAVSVLYNSSFGPGSQPSGLVFLPSAATIAVGGLRNSSGTCKGKGAAVYSLALSASGESTTAVVGGGSDCCLQSPVDTQLPSSPLPSEFIANGLLTTCTRGGMASLLGYDSAGNWLWEALAGSLPVGTSIDGTVLYAIATTPVTGRTLFIAATLLASSPETVAISPAIIGGAAGGSVALLLLLGYCYLRTSWLRAASFEEVPLLPRTAHPIMTFGGAAGGGLLAAKGGAAARQDDDS